MTAGWENTGARGVTIPGREREGLAIECWLSRPRILYWRRTNESLNGAPGPTISEFFGISIYMYWREHGRPHFHAVYGGEEAVIAIDDLSVLEGSLSARARGLVVEWATLHQEELRQVWEAALRYELLSKIEPLR